MRSVTATIPSETPLPAMVAHGSGASVARSRARADLDASAALQALAHEPHLLCHASFLIERLGFAAAAPRALIRQALEQRHCDAAELFAFVCPARFATPTPDGLARALGIEPAAYPAETLLLVTQDLLDRLASPSYPLPRETAENAAFLTRANWPWAPAVLEALRAGHPRLDFAPFATGLNVWDRIEEWEEDGGRPPGSQHPVSPGDAQRRLDEALGMDAETRLAQRDYAGAAAHAFQPRERKEENLILLAEAGTGLGKTLGYLAPAAVWARRNNAPVWVSTYTKNLQRQLDQETSRLIPDPEERRVRVAIRKGRENYVCLFNLQEAFGRMTGSSARSALLAMLIARWARTSRDGDMVGGDFPVLALAAVCRLGDRRRRPHAVARKPRADRSARRVHLCRLPALPPLLHRAGDASRAAGRHRDRQSRAGAASGGRQPGARRGDHARGGGGAGRPATAHLR